VTAEVLTLDLSLRRKSTFWYSVGMALYVLMIVALYPSFKDSTELDSFATDSEGLAALFGISGTLTSPSGWLNANLYANFLPLIVLLLTVGYGAFALAGQEKDGHLELVLSLPFARARVVVEKVGAMAVQALIFGGATFLAVLVGQWFELTVGNWALAGTTLAAVLLGIDFGLLALAIGAHTGARGTAIGLAATVAAASYLISAMAPVVDWLEPFRYLSLFYWSVGNDQLDTGVGLGSFLLLLGVGVAVAGAAVAAFQRHDLS
jgi:ABC-2 type transport system permease protein